MEASVRGCNRAADAVKDGVDEQEFPVGRVRYMRAHIDNLSKA